MVADIRSFEGWCGWYWPIVALARFAVALACPAVAAIVTFGSHRLAVVVLADVGGAVALCVVWGRRAWWSVLADRQHDWLDVDRASVEIAWLNIRPEDHWRVDYALRREHLNGRMAIHGPGPVDAPELSLTIHVRRPVVATRHLDRSVSDATRETLERIGTRARVDSQDVGL
jgi:hypothetical protein